jgi:ubiquinone/menaquinone biosynthesis C-methylase UbiE
MPFLRKTTARDPLPVTMSGVRMGERLLQVGVNDARLAGVLAAKVGLSGHAAMIVRDESAATRARAGIADAGGLVDLHVSPLDTLPFPPDGFDAIVVHNMDNLLASINGAQRAAVVGEWRRVLRMGGRIVVIEGGTRSGLGALLRPAPKADADYERNGGTIATLEAAGFRPVRLLGDREGYKFIEGLKTIGD